MAKAKKNKKIVVIILVVIILLVGGFLLYKTLNHNKTIVYKSTFHPKPGHSKAVPHRIKTTNPNLNTSNVNQSSTSSSSTNSNINTNSSLFVASKGDNIVVHTPYQNETIFSGFPINGTAKVDQVNYILIDNQVGQIAQGSLKVTNGKFQGTINFTPHANSGVLQVYYPNPTNGAEEDVINIDVNY